jgi:hypothetical protein
MIPRNFKKNLIHGFYLPLLFFAFHIVTHAGQTQHIYSTGETLELDRVASAWLIKRYVAPAAEFKFFPEGQLITEGIAFDTPDAQMQRTHKLATFEVIKNRYQIPDPKLNALTAIVHNAEINFWTAEQEPQAAALVQRINQAIKSSKGKDACLAQCFTIFDEFIERR